MIGALVLAAGSSRRFGDDKRKARLPDGTPVLHRTLENVLTAFDDVLVVLRVDDDELQSQLLEDFSDLRSFKAPDSSLGMGHSLANAIARVDGWEGVFVCLGDMPLIAPETYRLLVEAMSSSVKAAGATDIFPIIVPYFGEKRGHPVGFHRHYYGEIGETSGDQGAKQVLAAHSAAINRIQVEDRGVVSDIDYPGDL